MEGFVKAKKSLFLVGRWVIFTVDEFKLIAGAESLEPGIETVQQDGGLLADSPWIKLCETDIRVDIYLRQTIHHGTGDTLIAYGIVNISVSHEGYQLFRTVFVYFLNIDGVAYFISQVMDAEDRRWTFYYMQGFACQVQLAFDEQGIDRWGGFPLYENLLVQYNRCGKEQRIFQFAGSQDAIGYDIRSEERRVGKECL